MNGRYKSCAKMLKEDKSSLYQLIAEVKQAYAKAKATILEMKNAQLQPTPPRMKWMKPTALP